MALEKMYNTTEASEFLGCTTRDIQRYIREGKIPAIKIGKGYKIKESVIRKIQDGELKI